ncbi:hypothetical protein GN316_01810 [Xylophilus sp. Kf1]|nr:hypothetical protein [Xylophilus sp. Kf1]
MPHPTPDARLSFAPPHRHRAAAGRGFFLMELLGAVALIAVLVGLVLPGMQQMLRAHRVRAVARDLGAELIWLQTESARRGVAMVMRFKTASDCRAASAGATQRCGWDVFVDRNEDTLRQPDETVVHTYDNPGDLTITPRNGDTVFIDTAGNFRNRNSVGAVGTSFLVEAARGRPDDPTSRVCINSGNRVRVGPGGDC